MDPVTWSRIEELFSDALDRPPAERDAFLDRACGGNDALRAELGAMLAVHADDAALGIERMVGPADDGDTRLVGRKLGAWRIERLLGRGGMAEVWLAARDDGQYEQSAALKILKPGWRTSELAARFRRERQLLALFRHPNIARLLDGGVTEAGLPFLAMEYIDGVPITRWCRDRALPPRERLDLFLTVCDAVLAAHANLVVHRDLKPSNILVTAGGRPILLDFGIARLLDPSGDSGPATREVDRLLTPEYASPEQLRGEPATTGDDAWGLGVLLHELLAGEPPFAVADCTPAEILRALERGPRPASLQAPQPFRAALTGDLDRILAKSLSFDASLRYASVGDLRDDLLRWKSGLTVRARPATFRYRSARFLKRNRGPVLAGTLVAVALLGFGGVAAWQARRAAAERDTAVAERERSDRVLGLLVDLFQASDPTVNPGGDTLRVGDFLAAGETKIADLDDQPGIQSRLWETMASIHGARSRFAEERRAIEAAVAAAERGGSEADRRRLRHLKAKSVFRLDGAAAAEPLFRASLADHESALGRDHPSLGLVLSDLAETVRDPDERGRLLDRALALMYRAPTVDSTSVAGLHNSLGIHHWTAGMPVEAGESFARALALLPAELGADHPHRLDVTNNLATCMVRLGRFEEARPLHERLLVARERILGPATLGAARSRQNLGVIAANLGRHDEAVEFLARVLAITEELFPPDHPERGNAARNLGLELIRSGRRAEAIPLLDRAERILAAASGNEDPALLHFRIQRAGLDLVDGTGNPADTVRLLVARLEAAAPEGSLLLADALSTLGACDLETGSPGSAGDAARAFDRALSLYARAGVPDHPAATQAACGAALARSAAGGPFDRAAVAAALERCRNWGLGYPGIVERAGRLVGRGS